MKVSHKIFVSIVVTAFICVVSVLVILRVNMERGIMEFAQKNHLENLRSTIVELEKLYSEKGSWDSLNGERGLDAYIGRPDFKKPTVSGRFASESVDSDGQFLGGLPFLGLDANMGLLDGNRKWVAGAKVDNIGLSEPIIHNGSTIGFLVVGPMSRLRSHVNDRFVRQQFKGLLWASVVILLGAGISAALLSWHIVGPINLLVRSVRNLSAGDFSGKVNIQRSDEIGLLAKDFNLLIATLSESRKHQRQWISDISHELRTPVTILMGEIECMEDGHTSLTIESIQSLKSEVDRLRRLIEDLNQLSKSDAGTLQYDFRVIDIDQEVQLLIKKYVKKCRDRNVIIESSVSSGNLVSGDPLRIQQLISNLLENSLTYTESPGRIAITGTVIGDVYRLTIEDSGPGITDDDLEKIFLRLYKIDPSRSRTSGSSGLGLAICQSIAKAHDGKISARHSYLGGLAVDVELPINSSGV